VDRSPIIGLAVGLDRRLVLERRGCRLDSGDNKAQCVDDLLLEADDLSLAKSALEVILYDDNGE